MTTGQDSMRAWIAEQVQRTLKYGFGDLAAPLAENEYITMMKSCTQPNCSWHLPIEWMRGTEMTRLRGALSADVLIQEHLETHVVESWERPT